MSTLIDYNRLCLRRQHSRSDNQGSEQSTYLSTSIITNVHLCMAVILLLQLFSNLVDISAPRNETTTDTTVK